MGIFDNIGHFFFGGPAKTESATTTNGTVTTSPYAPAVQPINDYLANTTKLYNGGAPQISPYEQQGYDALKSAAGNTAGLDAATKTNTDTVNGQYLTPDTNPYLADIAKRVSGGTMATINDTFGGKGRTGSGLHQELAGEGVAHSLTDLYGSEYDKERQLQQQAVGQAPSLTAASLVGPEAMAAAGQQISARPFDVNTQYGSILNNIAKLGTTATTAGNTTGLATGNAESNGWLLNKLFPA